MDKTAFSINFLAVNITYFCSKITTVTDDVSQPATSGCFRQNKNGYDVQVCACRSVVGREPCNFAKINFASLYLVLILSSFVVLNFVDCSWCLQNLPQSE